MKTAICVVAKNEEASIAEWIAYHLAVGFDCIIVFDNASTDRTAGVIASFCPHHDVRRINWANATPGYQIMAYDFMLSNFRFEFDWICFIDCDEFILPIHDESIGKFFDRLPNACAVGANWAMFGSSGHMTSPEGLVIENFVRRSDPSFGPNRHVKSFIRPAYGIKSENPHYFQVNGLYVKPDGGILHWETPGVTLHQPVFDVLQINHYFVKSAEQWSQKISRGYHDIERAASEFAAYDRNEVTDTTILKFAERTREIMRALPDQV